MALTENLYVGDGSTVLYSFTFPYIEESDVKVSLDSTITTEYTLANATTIQFATAPATGVSIRIYRLTGIEEVSATFFPGSAIRAQDLNDNFEQTLYVAQELQGNTLLPDGSVPMVGNLDLGGFDVINGGAQFNKTVDLANNRITSVITPVDSTDAANKAYVDSKTGGSTDIAGTSYVYYIATQGDTVLTSNVGGVPVFAVTEGLEQVYVDGSLQQPNVDYTTNSTTQITFTQPLLQDDVVAIHCINNVPLATTKDADEVIFTYPGGVQQTVQQRLEQYVSVKDFGAKGDGVTDDTAAIENAINANPKRTVIFPAGTYVVTRQLNLIQASYSIRGERCERGQNTNLGDVQHSTIIDFSSGVSGEYLVNRLVTGVGSYCGPFTHENLYFKTGEANGFQFGSEDLPVADSGDAQKFNFSIVFKGCNFHSSTRIQHEDAADGTVTRLTNTAIALTKAFESVIEDCSFWDYRVGIRLYGCDKPVVNRVRISAEIPIDIKGVGTFTVQHTVNDFQSEGWKFTPIRNEGAGLAVSNYRSEGNSGSGSRGMGRFVLPGVTATITAGSLDVTFSSSMDNILIPGLSLIELTDGADNTDTVLVTAVSGTTVTVSGGAFAFTDSYNASTVTRIHGYGLIHRSGPHGTTVVNASPSVYENCPAFVMVSGRSNLAITNALAESGNYGNIEVLALGNRAGGEQFYMQNQMILTGCSGLLVPSNPSPLISVSNFSDSLGSVQKNNTRMPVGDSFDGLKVLDRKWIYTPKRFSTATNNNQDVTFKEVVGDPNSSQSIWAWYLGSYASETRRLRLYDSTIPSTTNGALRIRVKAKKKSSGTTTISVNAEGDGGTTITSFANVTDEWSTFTWIGAIPSQWSSSSRGTPTLRLTSSDDVYVAAVVIEDVAPLDAATGRPGFYKVSDAYSTSSGVSGTGNLVATLPVQYGVASVKIYGYNTGTNAGYSYAVKEFNVGISKFAGTVRAEVFENISNKSSVNSGVISLDFALAEVVGPNGVELTVTPTITGSDGTTTCFYFADIEFTGRSSNPQIIISA